MKILFLIGLGLFVYYIYRRDRLRATKGHVSYQSPDEHFRRDVYEKDVTDRSRIVPESDADDR